MSRQLLRIRSMVSEIEEIQRQGQSDGKNQLEQRSKAGVIPEAHFTPTAAPVMPAPSVQVSAPEVKDPEVSFAALASSIAESVNEAPQAPVTQEMAKISMQLSANIIAVLKIENSDESVEVRQVKNTIEIRFADGKAVHLPLKNVA